MKFELDPTGTWAEKGVPDERLMDAIGVLPIWAMEAAVTKAEPWEYLDNRYLHGGGLHEFKGGELTPEGLYKYPEDPPMWPVAKMVWGDNVLYFYQHAMVAINNRMTRMD